MDNFELPTNVKQIGSIEKGLRVYVEDYVFTFIQQYTQAGGSNERLAVLVGRFMTIDNMPVLFISGAIEGKYCILERGGMEFTDKSNEYILDTMNRYFGALEIVGWVQSQPGYGTYLSSKYYNYHMQNFKKEYQVLFVADPIQRINTFYMYNENEELSESKGYFVYYDKNKAMHEYMMDAKLQNDGTGMKSVVLPQIEDSKVSDSAPIKELTARGSFSASKRPYSLKRTPGKVSDTSHKYSTTRPRSEGGEQRKLVNLLAGLCAVMFLISFVLGAGLIRSDDRINILEQNLATLNTAYRDLAVSLEPTMSAFASGNSQKQVGVVLTEDGNKLLEAENSKAAEVSAQVVTAPVAQASSQVEVVPVSADSPSDGIIPDSYTVEQGDNLIGISRKIYGNPDMVDKIMEANKLTDPDKIFFGQVLILPKP